jgi:hypothetical protein
MAEAQITVWRLIAHHNAADDALRWFLRSNVIAIGWGNIGSVETGRFRAPANISEALRETYPDLKNAGSGGPCLLNFCHQMGRGDLVIVSDGHRRKTVMEITGDYEYKSELEPAPIGDYQHQRNATMIAIDPNELWLEAGSGAIRGQSIRWTLIECARPINGATKQRLTARPATASFDPVT